MSFYVSVFKNSKAGNVTRMGGAGAKVMSVSFELEGQPFIGMNGGPHFHFTEAISMFVDCATQAEVDELWGKLTQGGAPGRCGWLKDKFGLSWQIIPASLGKMLGDQDGAKAKRAMDAMMQMSKIDLGVLKRAFDGEA